MVRSLAFGILSSCMIGCADTGQSQDSPQPDILSDVAYSIIGSDTVGSERRSIDVRLEIAVSEEILRAMAMRIRGMDSRRYERTFISYYLPEMEVGSGAWATTHFNPTLSVRILGLSFEQEDALQADTQPDRDVLGRWLDQSPFTGGRIEIFSDESGLQIEQKFPDGSTLKRAITETNSPIGRRFDLLAESPTGDHWIVDESGNLAIRDDEGAIATERPIN